MPTCGQPQWGVVDNAAGRKSTIWWYLMTVGNSLHWIYASCETWLLTFLTWVLSSICNVKDCQSCKDCKIYVASVGKSTDCVKSKVVLGLQPEILLLLFLVSPSPIFLNTAELELIPINLMAKGSNFTLACKLGKTNHYNRKCIANPPPKPLNSVWWRLSCPCFQRSNYILKFKKEYFLPTFPKCVHAHGGGVSLSWLSWLGVIQIKLHSTQLNSLTFNCVVASKYSYSIIIR